MVVRGRLNRQTIALSLKRTALTVALDEDTVLVVDRAGRLWSFYTEGHHFRRGLNGSVLGKWTQEGLRQRRRLGRSESDLVVRRAALIVQALRDRLELETTPTDPSQATREIVREIHEILGRAADFDVAAAHRDVERYYQVYKPIGILPPDQYLALVLQVTEGCSFNTCTFCTFYKERPFRIKSAQELRAHIVAVRAFLDDSMLMRKGVFLADANALVVPQGQMAGLLEVVVEELGEAQEMFAFLDGFSGQKKSAEDYAALAERGLRRVYVGLESGHDPLLAWVRKPGRAADAVAAVQRMKAGGVSAGVIVMLGMGGKRYGKGHVRDTIAAVNRMELGRGDLLYFSEFIPAGTPYETHIDAPELRPLSRPQMQAQREAIVSGLRFGKERPQIATYDIREFVY
jgi:radical SAM superfamily enzyme YgiQ (UPF0313 family)